MKYKESHEDFRVTEVFDFEVLNQKEQERSEYYYFYLTKKDYTHFSAMKTVARIFGVPVKNVTFAGTKDRIGITKQVIAVRSLGHKPWKKNVEYLNQRYEGLLHLEFISIGNARINLGDNQGNAFEVVLRDVDNSEDLEQHIHHLEKYGVVNLFGDQRFGYAKNSHIVGKYILQNNMDKALYTILTSLPERPSDDHRKWVEVLEKNWELILEADEQSIQEVQKYMKDYSYEYKMLEHLKGHKGDVSGAFTKLQKKMQTLYIGAYQGYIFNKMVTSHRFEKNESLPLVSYENDTKQEYCDMMEVYLREDGLVFQDFYLSHLPDIRKLPTTRKVYIDITDFHCIIAEDENHESKNKITLKFVLPAGSYATEVIKQVEHPLAGYT